MVGVGFVGEDVYWWWWESIASRGGEIGCGDVLNLSEIFGLREAGGGNQILRHVEDVLSEYRGLRLVVWLELSVRYHAVVVRAALHVLSVQSRGVPAFTDVLSRVTTSIYHRMLR